MKTPKLDAYLKKQGIQYPIDHDRTEHLLKLLAKPPKTVRRTNQVNAMIDEYNSGLNTPMKNLTREYGDEEPPPEVLTAVMLRAVAVELNLNRQPNNFDIVATFLRRSWNGTDDLDLSEFGAIVKEGQLISTATGEAINARMFASQYHEVANSYGQTEETK